MKYFCNLLASLLILGSLACIAPEESQSKQEQNTSGEAAEPDNNTDREHTLHQSMSISYQLKNGIQAIDNNSNWQPKGPIEFLKSLQRNAKAPGENNPHRFPCYVIEGTHRGWIQENDIPQLLAMMDSEEACQAVMKSISSLIPLENSTVGTEAAHLVLSFKAEVENSSYGGYPVMLHSLMYEIDKEELRAWWAKYSQRAKK